MLDLDYTTQLNIRKPVLSINVVWSWPLLLKLLLHLSSRDVEGGWLVNLVVVSFAWILMCNRVELSQWRVRVFAAKQSINYTVMMQYDYNIWCSMIITWGHILPLGLHGFFTPSGKWACQDKSIPSSGAKTFHLNRTGMQCHVCDHANVRPKIFVLITAFVSEASSSDVQERWGVRLGTSCPQFIFLNDRVQGCRDELFLFQAKWCHTLAFTSMRPRAATSRPQLSLFAQEMGTLVKAYSNLLFQNASPRAHVHT